MPRSSRFGHIEYLPSGKWRARCTGPDGRRRSKAFRAKTDARVWLSQIEADIARGVWEPPEPRRVTVGSYASAYIQRNDLRESTKEMYETSWRLHLAPAWKNVRIAEITPQMVRTWHAKAAANTGPTALSISYRLLRGILNVAVDDGVIPANPCRIRSASAPKPAKQARVLTAEEVRAVAAQMPDRYQALVLLLGFGGLRFGEATALRREDLSDDCRHVQVSRSVRWVGKRWQVGPPKTEAGNRRVALPRFVADALLQHIAEFVPNDPEAIVFAVNSGQYLARQNFATSFQRALKKAGQQPARVHWLRHTGATLAASTGASTKELMHRLGHSSSVAAIGYQHAVSSRDDEIADALDRLANPVSPPSTHVSNDDQNPPLTR